MSEKTPQARRLIKRGFDIGASVILGPPALLISGIGAAAFALTTGENPLFVQKRRGINGKDFDLYKWRSMPGADRNTIGLGIRDPRCTRIGGFMRRTRLDEVPQFINILKGDMSLVGPRPANKAMDEAMQQTLGELQYQQYYSDTCSVLPGACMPACGACDQSPESKTSAEALAAVAEQTHQFVEQADDLGSYFRYLGATIVTTVRDAATPVTAGSFQSA